jgi:hypothetical protein
MRQLLSKSMWFVTLYLGGLAAVGLVALAIRALIEV